MKEIKHLHVKLSEKEMSRLEKNAEKCNLSKSTYIRKLLEGNVPRESPPMAYIKMMNELCAIGNNLNQIAYVANSTGVIDGKGYAEVVRYLFSRMEVIDKEIMGEDKIIPVTGGDD